MCSSPGQKSACAGQRSTTFKWMTLKHTSSPCVSLIDVLLLCYQLKCTVLNPAICFLWIQSEWDIKYIKGSKGIILGLVSTTYYYIPCLNHLSCRCTGTVTRNHQQLQLQCPLFLSNPLPLLGVDHLQLSLKSNVPYMKRNPHFKCSLWKPNLGSMLWVRHLQRRPTFCGSGRRVSFHSMVL